MFFYIISTSPPAFHKSFTCKLQVPNKPPRSPFPLTSLFCSLQFTFGNWTKTKTHRLHTGYKSLFHLISMPSPGDFLNSEAHSTDCPFSHIYIYTLFVRDLPFHLTHKEIINSPEKPPPVAFSHDEKWDTETDTDTEQSRELRNGFSMNPKCASNQSHLASFPFRLPRKSWWKSPGGTCTSVYEKYYELAAGFPPTPAYVALLRL